MQTLPTPTIFAWRFWSCSVRLAPLHLLHTVLLWGGDRFGWRCFCPTWVWTQWGCDSFPFHHIQEGCSTHFLAVPGESCLYLKIGKKLELDFKPHLGFLLWDKAAYLFLLSFNGSAFFFKFHSQLNHLWCYEVGGVSRWWGSWRSRSDWQGRCGKLGKMKC